ncbi:ArsC/Spx/MgsR family protein [Lacinutrix gracilariae]|uniref:ArsC/Spx/MgsR family protein n=1 Tax=Lacinutrix gracilariae TaxID=1747198 RepID=A0ABW5K093_9FLAO
MILIYHNPESSDSIECLNILKKIKKRHKVIRHIDNPLTERKLKRIVKLLNIKPIQLIRTDASIWKDHYQDLVTDVDDFEDIEYIKMMTEFPTLIRIPIVINGDKAAICNPPEKILSLLAS